MALSTYAQALLPKKSAARRPPPCPLPLSPPLPAQRDNSWLVMLIPIAAVVILAVTIAIDQFVMR